MPNRLPKPCAHPGCPALTRERFCEAHHREWRRKQDDGRESAARRGYCSASWRRLRTLVLARDVTCQWPGCFELATQVDHIVPKARGGEDSLKNAQGLCTRHHAVKTATRDGGFGRG